MLYVFNSIKIILNSKLQNRFFWLSGGKINQKMRVFYERESDKNSLDKVGIVAFQKSVFTFSDQ